MLTGARWLVVGRWREYQGVQGLMNGALSEVLDVLGFEVSPFGSGRAWIVTGRRAGWQHGRVAAAR